MRLTGRKLFLFSLGFVICCSDPSGPTTVSGRFELNDIDGRALPTPHTFAPGQVPTILSSTVTFDRSGGAKITQHQTEWNGADLTWTYPFTYKITGSNITLDCAPVGIDALCDAHYKGTLVLGRLSLEMGYVNYVPIIYHYRPANQ